jgi:hypothetical protein
MKVYRHFDNMTSRLTLDKGRMRSIAINYSYIGAE